MILAFTCINFVEEDEIFNTHGNLLVGCFKYSRRQGIAGQIRHDRQETIRISCFNILILAKLKKKKKDYERNTVEKANCWEIKRPEKQNHERVI